MSEKEKTVAELYPDECWAAVHNDQTMSLHNNLSAPDELGGIPYLTLHGKYSRFTLSILDTSGTESKGVKVNIRGIDEIAYLIERYEYAKSRRDVANTPEETAASPAYTVKIRTGEFKGKTPAEVLLDDANQKAALERSQSWLAENLTKYPANGTVIEAIEDAINLLNTGALQPKTVSSTVITLFDERFKIMGGGKVKAVVNITADFSRGKNPWHFYIENTPVENGNPVGDKKACSINLNDMEMAGFIYTLKSSLDNFNQMVYKDMWDKANELRWKPDN